MEADEDEQEEKSKREENEVKERADDELEGTKGPGQTLQVMARVWVAGGLTDSS